MHQLCHTLNTLGQTAYMYYIGTGGQTSSLSPSNAPILYKDTYPNIQTIYTIDDKEENVLILPEIYTRTWFKEITPIQHIRVAIWWLSFNNAIAFDSFTLNVKDPNLFHLFQSEYVKQAILPNLTPETRWLDLHDYTQPLFLESPLINLPRTNRIAYNPTKDVLFSKYVKEWHLLSLPLVNLTPTLMWMKLHECKIYVDLGPHPGKDRIPREAALAGCVIITNQLGSAANPIDLPIEEKVDGPDALKRRIEDVLENYEVYYKKQGPYREWIRNEKKRFIEQVQTLIEKIMK